MEVNSKTVYRFSKFIGSDVRPVLQKVLVTKNKMVATDSYKLLEITNPNEVEKDQLLHLPDFISTFKNTERAVKVETVENKTDGNQFPDYEQIMPKTDPIMEFQVNAKLMIECLEQFKNKETDNNYVTIKLYSKEMSPIVMQGSGATENIKALLMQLKK